MTKGFLIFRIQEQQEQRRMSAKYSETVQYHINSKMNKISIKKDNKMIQFRDIQKHILQKVHV